MERASNMNEITSVAVPMAADCLRRRVKSAEILPNATIVSTLSTQLQMGEEASIGLILCAESSRDQINAQGRHHRRRILDRAAAQVRAGAASALGCDRSAGCSMLRLRGQRRSWLGSGLFCPIGGSILINHIEYFELNEGFL